MGAQQLQQLERRSNERRRVLKGGVVTFDQGLSTLVCVVREISANDARLQIQSESTVPNTFKLFIELDGMEVECSVVWRDGSSLAVEFISDPTYIVPTRTQVVDLPTPKTVRQQLLRKPEVTLPQSMPVGQIVEQAADQSCNQQPSHAIPVLIAEDDCDDRYLIGDAFKESNFDHPISFVENGEELLKYLRGEEPFITREMPGLVLLDLNMPKMDGRTALLHMKTDPELRRIPVIVLTTSNAEEDIEQTYELGVSAFVTKPSRLEEMKDLVQSLNDYWMRFVAVPSIMHQP